MSYALSRFRDLSVPPRSTLAAAALLLGSQALFSLAHVLRPQVLSVPLRNLLFPWLWIDVALLVFLRTDPSAGGRRRRRVGIAVGAAYFLVLAAAGGLVGPGGEPAPGLSVQLTELPPGWNPAVFYGGELLRVAVVPYTAFGYAVLSYLVYLTAVEARSAVAGGVLGLFSCVSCTLPVIASVVGGFVGGGTALVAAASAQTYALGTVVFVVTVLLLTLRPGLPRQ